MVLAAPLRERVQATRGISDLTAGSRALRLLEGHGKSLDSGASTGHKATSETVPCVLVCQAQYPSICAYSCRQGGSAGPHVSAQDY